jgi:hypothetical protein
MKHEMKRWTLGTVAAVAIAVAAVVPGAEAGGLPSGPPSKGVVGVGNFSGGGVAPLDGGPRYVVVPVSNGTLVLRISQLDGTVLRYNHLRGSVTIPAVAYDSSPGGLSADGSTLVLPHPRYSFVGDRSRFAVLDAERLRLRKTITVKGDFTFDAISPNGSTMYLVEYLSPQDPTSYRVRSYDVRREELDPQPIIDPSEASEQMAGLPMTRATSPDGRWEYTLYERARGEPFIHALDTKRGTAACIDLPQLEGEPTARMGLDVAPGDAPLTVLLKGRPTLAIDPEGFEVTEVEEPASAPPPADGDGFPWVLAGLAAAGALGVAAWLRIRRRGDHRAVTEEALPKLVDIEDAEERGTPVPR